MPFPNDETRILPTEPVVRASCPPELSNSHEVHAHNDRTTENPAQRREDVDESSKSLAESDVDIEDVPLTSNDLDTRLKERSTERSRPKGQSPVRMSTPEAKDTDSLLSLEIPVRSTSTQTTQSPTNYEVSNVRLRPNYTSSFLRVGSKFAGTQQSDKQIYKVEVDIKHVDMAESFLCGYLRIEGLTEDHPTLTTYFEGEIIGPKYTFQTKHEDWGATDKTDMQHWYRFPAWRPLEKQAKKPDFHYKNCAQKENIFMRWKEYFLVPDHRVREIMGASFEGFYYICFNQVQGTVSGIYFHAKSEKYQQLELKHVRDNGCMPAIEFR